MKIVIIGGGIIGLAIARELANRGCKNIVILEKETEIALHQSSRNSGVIHAGLYYKPGSLKANLCRKGIEMMKAYCTENRISWSECGKVVVSKNKKESEKLDELFLRGGKNKLRGIKKLSKKEVNLIEPYLECSKGLFVPEESIVNFKEVAQSYLCEIKANGVEVKYNSKFKNIINKHNKKIICLENGESLEADLIIASAGVYSDFVANELDIDIEGQKIMPFRGEYYNLKDEFNYLVKGLIYPVPNPNLPFLGVHFTKMIDGKVEAGPNAILALAREGYDWKTLNTKELKESLTYPGFIKFLNRYPITSLSELARSLSKTLFTLNLKNLIPDINEGMLERGSSGIRAQLMNKDGNLIQDFDIRIKGNFISVLNAPSPAATSSLAIANYVVNYLDI